MKLLIAKVQAKARQFPALDTVGVQSIRTFAEFDSRYTAPLHGFRDARDYWARSSARLFLPRITVPTLLLNAHNDPLLAPECFPWGEAEANPALFLEVPNPEGMSASWISPMAFSRGRNNGSWNFSHHSHQ